MNAETDNIRNTKFISLHPLTLEEALKKAMLKKPSEKKPAKKSRAEQRG